MIEEKTSHIHIFILFFIFEDFILQALNFYFYLVFNFEDNFVCCTENLIERDTCTF